MNFVGLVGDGLQLGVELRQGVLQAEILVAVLFQESRRGSRRRSGPRPAESAEKKNCECSRTLAGAAAAHRRRECSARRSVFSTSRSSSSHRAGSRPSCRSSSAATSSSSCASSKMTHAGIGQHAGVGRAFAARLDGQIGEEQMVVDDDDVAFGRFPAHLGDEAALELLALAADAVVGAGIQLGPELAGLGQRRPVRRGRRSRWSFPSR